MVELETVDQPGDFAAIGKTGKRGFKCRKTLCATSTQGHIVRQLEAATSTTGNEGRQIALATATAVETGTSLLSAHHANRRQHHCVQQGWYFQAPAPMWCFEQIIIDPMDNPHPPYRRRFSRLASTYDRHAAVQQEVGERLLGRLDGLGFEPQSVLDIGCATGRQLRALYERFPKTAVVGVDIEPAMLGRARRHRGRWRRRFELVAGAAESLPIADASFDLVYSSMTLQWCEDPSSTLASIRRILRPGGMLLIATTGPDTLRELREVLGSDKAGLHAGQSIDAQRLGDTLVHHGFQEPVVDTDWLTTTHSNPEGLLDDLANTGVAISGSIDRTELKRAYLPWRDPDGHYPATWEIVYASAWAPEEGQPVRTAAGEEASVSVGNLKIRRRN